MSLNLVTMTAAGVVKVTPFSGEGKKPFTILRVVVTDYVGGKEVKTYVNVHTYDRLAENAAKYLKPGSQVDLSGKLASNERTNAQGEKTTELVIKADRIEFRPSGGKKTGDNANSGTAASAPAAAPAPAESTAPAPTEDEAAAAAAVAAATSPIEEDDEEELPF